MPQALIAKLVGLLALCLACVWLGYELRDNKAEAEISYLVTAHAEARSRQMAELAKVSGEYRRREAKLRDQFTEELNVAHANLTRAQDDARSARNASERLRVRVAALTAARCTGAAEGSAAPGAGPPADATGDLLADLFSRLDEAAGIIGEYADQARIAGAACERLSDAVSR